MQTVCDAPSGRGGTWNKDGVIVFTPDARSGVGLYRVSALGGTVTPVSKLDTSRGELSHRWPMFLPDGTHYQYMATNFAGQKGVDAIFVGSLDSIEKRFVVEATANAAYAAPGYLLFYRDKALLAQRFDLKRFALTGEPTTILNDIQFNTSRRSKGRYLGSPTKAYLPLRAGVGLPFRNSCGLTAKGKGWERLENPMCMATYS